MGGMRIGSLCSGYGGLDAAAKAILPGSRTVWHCELADGPAAILAHRFPGVPNHRDITQVDWSQVEPVDIVTAGFPCQDVSQAGARAGLKHGTRTGIFHSVMVAVEALRPMLVFLENVLGLLTADGDEWPDHVTALWEVAQKWSRVISLIDHKIRKARRKGVCRGEWEHRKRYERVRAVRSRKRAVAEFDRERLRSVPRAIATVLGALASAGFDAEWGCVRASDVGAPHRRERVFIVARHADGMAGESTLAIGGGCGALGEPGAVERIVGSDRAPTADACGDGCEGGAECDGGPGGGVAASFGVDVDGRGHVAHVGGLDVSAAEVRPGQVLRDMWGAVLPQEIQWTTRGQDQVPEQDPLLAVVREQQEGSREIGTALASSKASSAGMCGMRSNHEAARSSHRPQPGKQRSEQPDDAVPVLPFEAALARGSAEADASDGAGEADNGVTWGSYTGAIRRWEVALGRRAPTPTELGPRGGQRLSARFTEWLMGLPAGWVTDVPDLSRNEQLKALGNGVVVQQAAAAYTMLLDEWDTMVP